MAVHGIVIIVGIIVLLRAIAGNIVGSRSSSTTTTTEPLPQDDGNAAARAIINVAGLLHSRLYLHLILRVFSRALEVVLIVIVVSARPSLDRLIFLLRQ